MTLRRTLRLGASLLVLIFVGGWAEAASWTAEVGVGGVVVPDRWTALTVQSDLPSPWSLRVNGVVLEFPGPGEFEVPLFVEGGQASLTFERLEHAAVLDTSSLPLARLLFPGHVVLVDGLERAQEQRITQLLEPREPLRVTRVSPSHWPASFLAWGGISAVVAADPGPVLSPAQTTALRAWLASGGRLALLKRRTPSLAEALAPGSVVESIDALGLVDYGKRPHLGTVWEPVKAEFKASGPLSAGAGALVAVWVVVSWLVTRRAGPGALVATSLVLLAVVVVALATGNVAWNRGLSVQTRSITLPDGAGTLTRVEVHPSKAHSLVVDWPDSPPWALDPWRVPQPGRFARILDNDQVILESFQAPQTEAAP